MAASTDGVTVRRFGGVMESTVASTRTLAQEFLYDAFDAWINLDQTGRDSHIVRSGLRIQD
jgi:hypothetical protein